MLELTVRAEPHQLAPVRHRVADYLRARRFAETHVWRVNLAACEFLTLSIEQGVRTEVTLRVIPSPGTTRIEVVDRLTHEPAFETMHGHVVLRIATSWGVLRGSSTRVLWCDVSSEA